jgi:endonuclease III
MLPAMARSAPIATIASRLEEEIGDVSSPPREPLTLLVETILSQNTNDTNRDRAFASLMRRFGDLDAVAAADPDQIAAAIRDGGLHHQKARAIKAALERVAEAAGSLDLRFLAKRSLDEAMAFLLALPGVGPKTAGIVVLFAFDMPYFPVDTHIRRVTRRLGLVSEKEDPHARLNAILPRDAALMKRLHLQLITLGRRVCHPRRPECWRCPLRSDCPSAEAGADGLRRTGRATKMGRQEAA